MKNVPKIISSKDLSYINDMLNWLHTISKKINHYIKITKDKNVLQELNKTNKLLITIYTDLLNALN